MPINVFEFLILVIYILIIWYVYQSIVEELDQRTAITMNKGQLDEQLEKVGLEGKIAIQCGFTKTPLAEEMKTFVLIVQNLQAEGNYLYLDWQRCTFRTFRGDVKRLFRLSQGQNLDLFEAQSLSILAPGESFMEMVTLENCLRYDKETGYSVVKSIFSIGEVKAARASGAQFRVNLFFQKPARPELGEPDRFYAIACPFEVKKLPWQNAVYWRPKR